jgi:hypothetical protein
MTSVEIAGLKVRKEASFLGFNPALSRSGCKARSFLVLRFCMFFRAALNMGCAKFECVVDVEGTVEVDMMVCAEGDEYKRGSDVPPSPRGNMQYSTPNTVDAFPCSLCRNSPNQFSVCYSRAVQRPQSKQRNDIPSITWYLARLQSLFPGAPRMGVPMRIMTVGRICLYTHYQRCSP